jgi:hypothetical protein
VPRRFASAAPRVDLPEPEVPTTETRCTAVELTTALPACHLEFRPAMMT